MSKFNNEEIYRKLMESRKKDPKGYACKTIAVVYGELKNRLTDRERYEQGIITSKKFRPITDQEIGEMKQRIKETIVRMVRIYGLTQEDVDYYNTYSVGKLKITIA